jgi:hypothetical protein
MRVKSPHDFWAGVIFFALGSTFFLASSSYEMGTASKMGPGYFPRIVGALTALIGVFVAIGSFAFSPIEDGKIGAFAWRPLFFVIAANLIIGLMLGGMPSIGLPPLGLVLSIYALTFVAALAGRDFRFREVGVLATILAVGCYFGFVVLLKLNFQVWPLLQGLR